MIKFIENVGDFFSSNYFDEDFIKKVHDKSGYSSEDQKGLQKKITPLKDRYYKYKTQIIEGRLRTKDKIYETHQFHRHLLNALGYDGDHPQYNEPLHFSDSEVLPVRHKLYRGEQLHMLILEMQPLIKEGDEEPDGLFEQRYNIEDEETQVKEQRYHRSQWKRVFEIPDEYHISPAIINKAISTICLLEQKERPQFVMLLAGNKVFVIDVEKWFRGSYLQFDLEELFTEATINKNYNSLFYLILAKEMLAPDSDMVLMNQLEEDSHKSAYEVTKDLKEGIIHAVEALANEALYYRKEILGEDFDETNDTFESQVKDDCLSIVYRLLFVFYAESRSDLDILPISDSVYQKGYSLEMLRDLEQTRLVTDHSLNGYFFHESLKQLFDLMSSGYREKENGSNKSFRIRHIDSPLFDDNKLHHLNEVKFRNVVWQDVICQLSLSREIRGKNRGRISYTNLGINQLGSVYESLLAYRGFYAEEDFIEVHPKNKPKEGTLLVQRKRRDDFHTDEVLKDESGKEVVIPKGQFVYRLSGRDRQKSASYYTPEVLTQCTVKYTLKGILEKVENGEMKALELLDLKLLEPAMGAAAFHNELINQLAEAYLNYRQKEMKEKISPEKYREELQKVKAYIATNNAYGVDLNPTAIELGKLSLWLNVIHKDMETPFFANRLAVGNAVVGAWFKVYTEAQLKKKWWEIAPKMLALGPDGEKRKKNEIYHFLLPDKGMVPSAGIKLLKDEFPSHASRVSSWRSDAIKPISGEEFLQLQKICDSIDEQMDEYYSFQKRLNAQTKNKVDIWGGFKDEEQIGLNLRSYDEKEQLNDQRNRQSAPYYKLKMVMDYWCSLWFWDVRKAEHLPTRQQYINDIASILNLDLTHQPKAVKRVVSTYEHKNQPQLFEEPSLFSQAQQQIIEKTQKGDLFDNKERLEEVKNLSAQHRFFHSQLEFVEVFKEQGGFDVIVGNPPWVGIEINELGILGDFYPEAIIRRYASSKVKKLLNEKLEQVNIKGGYYNEVLMAEGSKSFMTGMQNYPLLQKQRNNLYKCVLVNAFSLLSPHGFSGLVHPPGIFEDPNANHLRKELYSRLKYWFEFKNAKFLFQEVHDQMNYCIDIFGMSKENVNFKAIGNLYHPSTIDGSIVHLGTSLPGGMKTKNSLSGKYEWNIQPHKNRIVEFNKANLKILGRIFNEDWEGVKLISIHSLEILSAIGKLASFGKQIEDLNYFQTDCWNETIAVADDSIAQKNKTPKLDLFEMIYNGPHFFVANPLYKSPRENYKISADYDVIDLNTIGESEFARTLFVTSESVVSERFNSGLEKEWLNGFKIAFSEMLNIASERTLQPCIIPPKSTHLGTVRSFFVSDETVLLEFAALCSSIVFDFYTKIVGRGHLKPSDLNKYRYGCSETHLKKLNVRILVLNVLNKEYTSLWGNNWQEAHKKETWSKQDLRLKAFSSLTPDWHYETPLRNWFERRQALVEIDVISALAMGLTLEELILIYNVQFPVLQQNEDDTWYDTKGNIVFTCSKGLTGVGLDRPVWSTIEELKAGETYEHTIEKSELYHGKKVTYYAPFDKCDRVEDYKVAWKHFEEVFKKEAE
jgi:hypothetical protein